MREPLVPRYEPRPRYPVAFLLAAAVVGVAGWAPQSSRFDERPPAVAERQPIRVQNTVPQSRHAFMVASADPQAMLVPTEEPAAPVMIPPPRPPSAPAASPALRPAFGTEGGSPGRNEAVRHEKPQEAARVALLAQIARMKAVLKLTPSQEQYWSPVEAVLRELAQQQAVTLGATNNVRAVKSAKITIGDADKQRLMSAAFPLLMTLREDQKQDAMQLARAMGLENVASAF